MADTQETIFIVKKAKVQRDADGNIIGYDMEDEADVRARYKRTKAREDVAKNNDNPKRKFQYRYTRLKLS